MIIYFFSCIRVISNSIIPYVTMERGGGKMSLAIGVDLGGTNIRTALVTKQGEVLSRIKLSTRDHGKNSNLVAKIAETVNKLLEKNRKVIGNITGVGIGIPGVIDAETGTVTQSPNLPEWVEFPLREKLSPLIPFPLTIENDANAAALGELTFGAAKGCKNIFCITLGTGVGGGIIVNGEILHGAGGMAGEIGHMTVFPNGPVCNCGNQGCLEALASATAIKRMSLELISLSPHDHGFFEKKIIEIPPEERDRLIAQTVAEAARAGETIAIRIFRRVGSALGIAIATLINIFNPEAIVIGGGVAGAWDLFITDLKVEIRKRALKAPGARVKILKAALGDDFGVLGAAALILHI